MPNPSQEARGRSFHAQSKSPAVSGALVAEAEKSGCRRFLGRRWIDADLVTMLVLVLELHDAVDQRIDRVVRADADVPPGVPFRAALADDDVAGNHALAAVLLDAAVLRVAVAAVARRADAFFMSHIALAQPSVMSLMRTSVKPCRCPCLRA